jgi:hypothetical protein
MLILDHYIVSIRMICISAEWAPFIRPSAKAWFPILTTAEGEPEQCVESSDALVQLCRSAVYGERGSQHERLAVLHHLPGVSQVSQRTSMRLLFSKAFLHSQSDHLASHLAERVTLETL